MEKKRPRAIAICIFSHKGHILVAEIYDSVKQEYFYRPIGGSIEYGEYSKDTLIREVREEVSAEITQQHYLGTLENIFLDNGVQAHEIAFIYDALFTDSSLYMKERIEGIEDDNSPFTIVWKPLSFFHSEHAPLYPDGLLELLVSLGYEKPALTQE